MPVFNAEMQERIARRVGVGIDMNVGAVLVDGKVVAAVHWAVDLEDVLIASAQDSELGRVHAQQVRILQNLAVAPAYRSMGIGKQLVEYVEERSEAVGATYVIGIASRADISRFYEGLGYRVLEPGKPLRLELGRSLMSHPVNGSVHLLVREVSLEKRGGYPPPIVR